MVHKLSKIFNRVFYISILISFSTIAIPLIIGLSAEEPKVSGLIWLVAYINFYVLWPLLLLTLIGSAILDFKSYGSRRSIREISFRILITIILLSIVHFGKKELMSRENQIKVTFENKSSKVIKHIKLHGRNTLTEFDNLLPESDTTLIFRGKDIIYDTDNSFENEVTLLYYMDSTWFRRPVLEGFSRWRVWNGPFQLIFNGPNSVDFKYIKENKP